MQDTFEKLIRKEKYFDLDICSINLWHDWKSVFVFSLSPQEVIQGNNLQITIYQ